VEDFFVVLRQVAFRLEGERRGCQSADHFAETAVAEPGATARSRLGYAGTVRMSERSLALSKFLSFVLRHDPSSIGVTLSADGWTDVDRLLAALAEQGKPLSRDDLEQLVASSDKQRFAFSPDGSLIRANQGHSVRVDLGYRAATPPNLLFHGTVEHFVPAIRTQGLLKGQRHHVHLSATRELATVVARRRGAPVIAVVAASAMVEAGHTFFCSANGVWLTDHVPVRFLSFEP
jgi:putative RNA 2'-phosphotransferase